MKHALLALLALFTLHGTLHTKTTEHHTPGAHKGFVQHPIATIYNIRNTPVTVKITWEMHPLTHIGQNHLTPKNLISKVTIPAHSSYQITEDLERKFVSLSTPRPKSFKALLERSKEQHNQIKHQKIITKKDIKRNNHIVISETSTIIPNRYTPDIP